MDDDVIFRYKNGRIIPIKVARQQSTNDYMNDKIRQQNKKVYTNKDIEKIYNYDMKVKGYKCGNFYLLKNYYGTGITERYSWVITKQETGYWNYIDLRKAFENNEALSVDNFIDGKNKLIEIANRNSIK